MKFIADFHIHSHYSIATSKLLVPEYLDYWAAVKGIKVVGTGDFTHPQWLEELKKKLTPAEEGLFKLKKEYRLRESLEFSEQSQPRFLLSAEISTIYKKKERVRKVHNLIFASDFEVAEKIQQNLTRLNFNIASDGRPILGMDSKNLLDLVLEASTKALFVPAHIWTPWFSLLGDKSGFDSVKECFEELTPHIYALETGLSSDPPMNWLCGFLDQYSLISNSDAHSPEKLGRNANIFNTELSYSAITDALKDVHSQQFLGTIDLFPQEGKYHYDGHRKCRVCWNPLQTLKNKRICPGCGQPVTVGVMNRVAQLSDRAHPHQNPNRRGFHHIIPLKEILAEILGKGENSKKVTESYFSVIRKIGPELDLLLMRPLADIKAHGDKILAESIRRMRSREVVVQEGYDGQYGQIRLFRDQEMVQYIQQEQLFPTNPAAYAQPPVAQELIPFDLEEFRRLSAINKQSFDPDNQARPTAREQIPVNEINLDQQRAAEHFTGPALIIAGPGTGKTRTLTFRIANLIRFKGVASQQILAVTFTNKAAREIAERLKDLLGDSEPPPLISTFHGFGLSVLKENLTKCGRKPGFFLLTDQDTQSLLKELGIKGRLNAITREISLAKQELLEPEALKDKELQRIYQQYQEKLQAENCFDLNDLIFASVLLLRRDKTVLEQYRRRFPWILVDEYQDINCAQYELIRLLAPPPDANLCVIGDPNQAIYGFRGSDVRFIRDFTLHYPGAALYSLNKSYRCSKTILKASAGILQEGRVKIATRLEPAGERIEALHQGVRIRIAPQKTAKAEAEFVARTVEEMMGGLGFFSMDSQISQGHESLEIQSLKDFAVLYRTKEQSRFLIKAFNDHRVPAAITGEAPFYREEPFSTLIGLARYIKNPGQGYLKKRLARTLDLDEVLKEFSPPNESSLVGLLERAARRFFSRETAARELDFRRLLDLARGFKEDYNSFFHTLSLNSGIDVKEINTETVSCMSLHAAKGLEFKCVFIIGCEEGLIPYSLFNKTRCDYQEEQRLLYVGMTRAKKYLFLTYTEKRTILGKERHLKRSSFLERIEKELLERQESRYQSKPRDKQLSLF